MNRGWTGFKKLINHLKFVKNSRLLARICRGYFNTLLLRRGTLRSIELAVTYQCQASCHKCYAANLARPGIGYLSVPEIKNIIDQAMRLGLIHVNITGGEPLLRRDLLDIVKACRPKEIMVSLVTNAYSMTEDKMKDLKTAGLNTIQISLDSADKNTHDALRGMNGSYDRVMQAALWAKKMGINLCFSTVISTELTSNKAEIYRLLDLAKRKDAFLLICDSGSVGGWENREEKMMTSCERNAALEELMRHPNARHHALYNFRLAPGCPAGSEKIYISAYGDVMPCDLIHDSFGNALSKDLRSIWDVMRMHPLYSKRSYDCVRYLEEFKKRKRN